MTDDERERLLAEILQLKRLMEQDYGQRLEMRRAFDREFRKLREANSAMRDAAIALINPLLEAGEKTGWRDGDETDRVYSWREFLPLVSALLDQPDVSAPSPPSEPKPERPPMLRVKVGPLLPAWLWRVWNGDDWLTLGDDWYQCSKVMEVDREASDPAALAIYDADLAKGGGA